MKTQTAIARIVNGSFSDRVKYLKLFGLAMRAMPGSPAQKAIRAAQERYSTSYFASTPEGSN